MIPAVAIFTLVVLAAPEDAAKPVLRAIAEVETGNKPAAVGKHGERGIYQFTAATWAQYTREPLSKAATDAALNDYVARQHLAWLASQLHAKGVAPTVFNLALAWNAGAGGVIRGTAPASSHDYAQRVVNLVESEARRE